MTVIAFTGDNSVRNRIFKYLSFVTVLGLALFLTSCFTVETEFLVKKSGESTAILTYTIEEEFISFWEGEEGSGYLLLPVAKRDFQQRSLQVEGANLVSYKTSNKKIDGKVLQIIRAEIFFDSPKALNDFFNGDFVLDLSDGKGSLEYSLYNPSKKISAEALERVLELVGESFVSVKVNAPNVITSGSGNVDKKSKEDHYSVRFADLLTGDAESNVTVTW